MRPPVAEAKKSSNARRMVSSFEIEAESALRPALVT
jgi:hypothetical protein